MTSKQGLAFALFCALLPGCSLFGIETGYRSITVDNHIFEPAEVTVPARTRFTLDIKALDDSDIVIAAPDLGISSLRIPATESSLSPLIQTWPSPYRYARLPLGPLTAGRYAMTCKCHGHPATAIIVAR